MLTWVILHQAGTSFEADEATRLCLPLSLFTDAISGEPSRISGMSTLIAVRVSSTPAFEYVREARRWAIHRRDCKYAGAD